MKVRCLKIIDVSGEELGEHPALKVGHEYTVLEISAQPKGQVSLRVHYPGHTISTDGPPGLWRTEMFEVLSPTIPSNWQVTIGGASSPGYTRIAPESWHRPGFWEDLIDWSPLSARAQEDYERELAVILRESSGR